MKRRKGLGLFLVLAAAACSMTGCYSPGQILHYMQPYQWGKLNRGIGGLGPEGYQTMYGFTPTAYFASVTDEIDINESVINEPIIAPKPAEP